MVRKLDATFLMFTGFLICALLTLSLCAGNVQAAEDVQWCCMEEYPGEQRFDLSFEGSGTKEDPFQIKSGEQLNHVRRHLDGHFIQINNIVINNDLNGELPGNFEPIGTKDDLTSDNPNYVCKAFIGSYDGNGKTISGLHIESETKYSGLFGYLGREFIQKESLRISYLKTGM